LPDTFDTLIDSFVKDNIGIAENFLSAPLAGLMRDNLIRLFAAESLHAAGTGNNATIAHDNAVRGDMIYWLDRGHDDVSENDFLDLIERFIVYLNATCYTGITGYEFHYARYAEGSFYKKHFDQFRSDSSRRYSMIIYLNEDWLGSDGGQLCIHQHGTEQNISPDSGRAVLFSSSILEHEVLVTHRMRMSITGWLKVN
jgi:SM-20-related protein